MGEHTAAVFLAQIVMLLLVGRALGELLQRIGQPPIMGQLLAGVLLGPSVLGALFPDLQHQLFPPSPVQKSMLNAVSQLGVLMLLLLTGMEVDFARVSAVKRAALSVSIAGIVLPFTLGFALGELLPESLVPGQHRLITALFLGTVLSISSVKIVATVIRDLGFMRRNVGQVTVAAAIIDDTLGWIILAVVIGLASYGKVQAGPLASTVLSTAAFLAISLTVGRRAVYFLIRWSNDHLVSEMPVITVILLIMGAMALMTQAMGVQTVLGAFVAGMLIGQSPILTGHIEGQLRGLIVALFMPIFFGLAGLSVDFTTLRSPTILMLSLAFILVASIGKFLGAFVGGKLGGMSRAESVALGCGMNARGSTDVIVATVGLAAGALSTTLFTMIVAMAIVTTLCMPPMLRWAVSRIPLGRQERQRLAREDFEEQGFVPHIERILLMADDSASSRLTSYLVGLLAAPRRIPITHLSHGAPRENSENKRRHEAVKDAMNRAAEDTQTTGSAGESSAPNVDLITRPRDTAEAEAVAAETKKGYDILFIGVEPLLSAPSTINPAIARAAETFEGAVCLVNARAHHEEQGSGRIRRILLPVIGASYSRDATDLTLAVAQAAGAQVTALRVVTGSTAPARPHGARSWGANAMGLPQSQLRDVIKLSQHYSVDVRTAFSERASAEEAILRELRSGHYDLVVLGVSTRPSETTFFGSAPAAVLERAPCSLLLVSS